LGLRLYLDIKHLYIKMAENTSGVHLWLVLWKAARALEARAHANVASLGIGLSGFGVLEALLHKGPLAVNELGAKVLLTSGSITTAIDRLERKGLVTRGNDPRDRRARIIRLTTPGRKFIRSAFADHERAMEQAVSHLKEQDRAALLKLLRRLGRGTSLDK
jgi:MarR family 2-MHQ and catechol resistance regulon transcriptional repressor